jgi:hypothetical protein
MADIQRIGATSDILGEGPIWDVREQALYWVDIRKPVVQRYDWATQTVKSWSMPEMVGSLAVREKGGLVVALRSQIAFFDQATGALDRIASPEAGREAMRFNDGKCDRQGRFWAGTMNDVTRDPEGTLYRLDPVRGCVPWNAEFAYQTASRGAWIVTRCTSRTHRCVRSLPTRSTLLPARSARLDLSRPWKRLLYPMAQP